MILGVLFVYYQTNDMTFVEMGGQRSSQSLIPVFSANSRFEFVLFSLLPSCVLPIRILVYKHIGVNPFLWFNANQALPFIHPFDDELD